MFSKHMCVCTYGDARQPSHGLGRGHPSLRVHLKYERHLLVFLILHSRCTTFNALFLVDGPFLFTSFDQSNRALLAVPTAAATLLPAATTLQCTVYFTDGKYQQILPSLQHDKQAVNKNRLSTRKWAFTYNRTAGQGLNTLFGFCRSQGRDDPQAPPLAPPLNPHQNPKPSPFMSLTPSSGRIQNRA